MKKTGLLTSAALIVSLGLVGCGGGGGTSSTSDAQSVSISGTAIDPELQSATVCLDLNHDMSCSQDEPTATTNTDGTFSLNVTQAQLDGDAPLMVINGTDKESGKAFKGKLMGDVSTTMQNITPLTTLIYAHGDRDMAKLERILGLTHEEMQENMISAADEKGDIAPLKVALVLEKSAEALSPKDPFEFYRDCSDVIEKADTTASLEDIILSMVPVTSPALRDNMKKFLDDVMNTPASSAYDLANTAREKALEYGIDFESMMEKITNS